MSRTVLTRSTLTRTAACLAALLALSACETVKGAGRDMQNAGTVIVGEAQETQAQM